MFSTGILICCTVPSEAVPFVYLASVGWSLQCLISALTQAGGGGLLFRLVVPSRCGEGEALISRLRGSGSRLLYMERALHCVRFQPSDVPQKRGLGCACVLCLPRPEQLRQPGTWRFALSPGAAGLLPSEAPASVSARASRVRMPCVSPRPSRWMSTIQNLMKSLVRNWRPVCSVVGDAVLGAEPAPFPSPLPPASRGLGWSAACELLSELAQTLCSANGGQYVQDS